MTKIDRIVANREFDKLIKIINEAKASDNPEKIGRAAEESLIFISKLSGSEIAKWIMNEAQAPLPNMPYMQAEKDEIKTGAQVGSSEYVNRGLARLVLTLDDVLDAAHLSPKTLARDLIEMSRQDGSKPCLIAIPKRQKGQKDNRDLKYTAKKRVATVIYYEAARTNNTLKNIRYKLNKTLESSKSTEDKAWDKIAKLLSPSEKNQIKLMGSAAKEPHQDTYNFQKLWESALA